jgi:hypothetical protein
MMAFQSPHAEGLMDSLPRYLSISIECLADSGPAIRSDAAWASLNEELIVSLFCFRALFFIYESIEPSSGVHERRDDPPGVAMHHIDQDIFHGKLPLIYLDGTRIVLPQERHENRVLHQDFSQCA